MFSTVDAQLMHGYWLGMSYFIGELFDGITIAIFVQFPSLAGPIADVQVTLTLITNPQAVTPLLGKVQDPEVTLK